MKELIKNNNYELDILKIISDKGKYAIITFIGICTYKLLDKAIDNGYNISFHFKNLNFSLSK